MVRHSAFDERGGRAEHREAERGDEWAQRVHPGKDGPKVSATPA